jgi:hypothetical protein
MSRIIRMIDVLFSGRALFWLAGFWVWYYTTFAIWTKETFATFASSFNSIFVYVPYLVFLIIASVVFARAFVKRFRLNPLRSILWGMLPLGALLFLLGFYMCGNMNLGKTVMMMEGTSVHPPWQSSPYVLTKIEPNLKEEAFELERTGGVFKFEPKVSISTGAAQFDVGIFPPSKIGKGYYNILNFGMAPVVKLFERGKLVQQGAIPQGLIPPGSVDFFNIEPLPYRFTIRLAPERIITKGKTRGSVFNLRSPTYHVIIEKGEQVVFEGASDSEIRFDDYMISFDTPSYWALMQIRKSPGYPVLALSFYILLPGIFGIICLAVLRVSDILRLRRTHLRHVE